MNRHASMRLPRIAGARVVAVRWPQSARDGAAAARRRASHPGEPAQGRLQAARRHRAGAAAAHVLLRPGEHQRRAERGVGAGRLGRRRAARGGGTSSRRASTSTRRRSSTARTTRAAPGSSQSDQAPITVLGEAFGAVRIAGQTITGVPAAHQPPVHQSAGQPDGAQHVRGLHADGHGRRGLVHRRLHHEGKGRATPRASAGCRTSPAAPATSRAWRSAAATWNFGKGGYVRADEQYAIDMFNTFYADVRYPIAIDDTTSRRAGRAVLPADLGRRRAARLVLHLGLRAAGGADAADRSALQLYWTQTGKGSRHAESRSARTRRTST